MMGSKAMMSRCAYSLSLLLMVMSCTPQSMPGSTSEQQTSTPTESIATVPDTSTVLPGDVTVSTDIRPGPNGPKLELTDLEGEVLIPAGTSSFVVQSATQLSFATRAMQVIVPPAYAEISGDETIEIADVESFVALVDDEEVTMEVLSLEETDEGQVLNYRLKDVPVSEDNALVEIKSKSGGFAVRGVVEKISKDHPKIEERFDMDSTALAYILESLGDERPRNLDQERLAMLKTQAAVQQLKVRLYQQFIDPELRTGQQARAVKDVVAPAIASALQAHPEVKTYLQQAKKCTGPVAQCSLPPLNAGAMQSLPPSLVRRAQLRQEARKKKLLAQQSGTSDSSEDTDAVTLPLPNSGNGNSGNAGNGNTSSGNGNSGNAGNGNANSGNGNADNSDNGNANSGNGNAGNSGNGNTNSGNGNAGNSGNGNTNSGNGNSGNSNTNSGNGNTNSGNGNSGNSNTNSGNGNTNSGNGNSGNSNTNSGNGNT